MILALFSRYWIALAVGVAVAVAAFVGGYKVRAWRCDAELLKVERANAKAGARMRETADTASAEYEQDRSASHADTYRRQTRVQTIYRDREVSGDCAMPDDARLVLVEAVNATDPATAAEPGR